MTRTSTLARRLGVAALAAATLGTVVPLVLAGPASAAEAVRLVSTPSGQTVSAGTCTTVTVTPLDITGAVANAATVTVTLTENANSSTQDVDFCLVQGGTPLVGGRAEFENGTPSFNPPAPPAATTRMRYTPGPSITGASSTDTEGDAPAMQAAPGPNDRSNPTGRDRATFVSETGRPIVVGVVGLVPGAARYSAVLDSNADGTANAGTAPSEGDVTFTTGGAPGSQQAFDAVETLDVSPASGSGQQGVVQQFTAVLRNATGQTVAGVTPVLRVTSGPNAAPMSQLRADCGPSNNAGTATCFFQGANLGTDTLLVFVQQSAGTADADAGEPRQTVTRTTTLAAVDRSQARFLVLEPERATTPAGTARTFTAAVTSATGAPVRDVSVVFGKDGVGRFGNGQQAVTVATGNDGVATATVTTTATETGVQNITASIVDPGTTQCGQAAGSGTNAGPTTPAGACADAVVATVTAAPTPTPTTTSTGTPTPTATATGSPTSTPGTTPPATATATSTPTSGPTSTGTPSPTVTPPVRPVVTLDRSTITAQEAATVRGTAEPGSIVQLLAYSRPSTTYKVVRQAVVGESGRVEFVVGPSGNTRLFLRRTDLGGGRQADSPSIVLTVRTSLNLKVARTGTRTYRFTGSTLPKRRGQLVTVFYEANGRRVIASRARVAQNGTYNVTRTFSGRGTFTFFTGTGTDINNAANNSNRVRTAIR